MIREDERSSVADAYARDVDATRNQPIKLAKERLRIDDDAWPDDRSDVSVEDTARHKVKFERVFANDDGVPCVVATLVAHNRRNLLGEEVGRLPLPFVAPLETDDHAGRHRFPFH